MSPHRLRGFECYGATWFDIEGPVGDVLFCFEAVATLTNGPLESIERRGRILRSMMAELSEGGLVAIAPLGAVCRWQNGVADDDDDVERN